MRTGDLAPPLKLPDPTQRSFWVVIDGLVLLPLALWAAFALRLGAPLPAELVGQGGLLLVLPALSIGLLARLGAYEPVCRLQGAPAMRPLLWGSAGSAALLAAFVYLLPLPSTPHTIIPLYALTASAALCGSRLLLLGALPQHLAVMRQGPEPVAIYGAGTAGRELLTQLQGASGITVAALLDDDPRKIGSRIRGVPVLAPAELRAQAGSSSIQRVLIATPSANRDQLRRILEAVEPLPARVQLMPGSERSSRRPRSKAPATPELAELRDVDVDDLLSRDAVTPDEELLRGSVVGEVVAVTGAGGSIGSELCRQIVQLGPCSLVLFEQSEYQLYCAEQALRREMDELGIEVPIYPLLGDVRQQAHLERIFRRLEVSTVYHAAAYKHVPLVEQNVIEGIDNNVIGTWRCAEAAHRSGVKRFVLLSSDKAVRPGNVMGASKRLGELTLQALARRSAAEGGPRYAAVRFGNVLDSSGSVVPLFRQQIRRGGPVTITHPEVTRYFMTIPEATSLVLQAGTLAEGGEVFVLDMGEPVRIDDLARRLIRLSGLTPREQASPDGDVPITYTGLRPGEKLHEELLLGDHVTGTEHPMILRAWEQQLEWALLERYLSELAESVQELDTPRVHRLLAHAVPDYSAGTPSHDLLDTHPTDAAAASSGGTAARSAAAEHRARRCTSSIA